MNQEEDKVKSKEKVLKLLFKKYVVPDSNSINNFRLNTCKATQTNFNRTASKFTTLTHSFASFLPIEISFEQKLYPTANHSREILTNNRRAFREMSMSLKTLELENYNQQKKKIVDYKNKLCTFRELVREVSNEKATPADGGSLPKIPQNKPPLRMKRRETALMKNVNPTAQRPVKWVEHDIRGDRPEAREGATLTSLYVLTENHGEQEERAYLFGGLSRDLHSDIEYVSYDDNTCILIFK